MRPGIPRPAQGDVVLTPNCPDVQQQRPRRISQGPGEAVITGCMVVHVLLLMPDRKLGCALAARSVTPLHCMAWTSAHSRRSVAGHVAISGIYGRAHPSSVSAAGLVGALPSKDRARRTHQDLQVKQEGPVVDVPEVEAQGLLPREVAASADLPQAGETWLDAEAADGVGLVLLDL